MKAKDRISLAFDSRTAYPQWAMLRHSLPRVIAKVESEGDKTGK